jgi:hypothetical protein
VPPNIALEPSALLKDERRGSARALGSTLGAHAELNKVSALVQEHQPELLKAWDDYFKSGNGNRGGQTR